MTTYRELNERFGYKLIIALMQEISSRLGINEQEFLNSVGARLIKQDGEDKIDDDGRNK